MNPVELLRKFWKLPETSTKTTQMKGLKTPSGNLGSGHKWSALAYVCGHYAGQGVQMHVHMHADKQRH